MGLRTLLRRRSTRLTVAVTVLLLLALIGVYALLLTGRNLPSALATNRVLLFLLWYVNVLLILVILFVLARNLLKLLLERRARILGSKFKTKLVATYVGLSLVPVLVLFFYATELLQQSIDRWFTTPVEEVVEQGQAVGQELLRMAERQALIDALATAEALATVDLDEPRLRPRLDRQLQQALRREGLDYLAVYRDGGFLHAVVDPQAGLQGLPEPDRAFLVEVALGGEGVRLQPLTEQGRMVLAGAAVDGARPLAVVVAGRLLPPTIARQGEELIRAGQAWRQSEVQRAEIEASQILLFLMITLMVLLASSWVGLHLARRVTVPILALADGTRRLGEGDLAWRVEARADDELGVLVGSFNRMAAEIERSRSLLEKGNQELLEANRRLAEERALVVAILQNVAAGVVALDPDERVFLVNGAALQMLDQAEAELRGRSIREAWGDEERRKLLPLVDAGGDPAQGGATQVRLVLGGDWKTFEAKRSPLADDGTSLGSVLVLEDLTELIQAQQLAAWSEAARRIAHEIKNPLTPIQLAAERVRRKHRQGGDGLGEAIEEGVEVIVREVDNLKAMVDEFSRYARMPHPHPVEIDLEALVRDVARLYHGIKPGVEVEHAIEPSAHRAWADPEQLRGALINLLDNALEATAAPGRVRVAAAVRKGRLRLEVADTGRGIPADAKAKLFLPHFSTKRRGTGLGLAIVHRIVSDHQGTIRVADNEPRGTVFTLELPLR